jgi:YbgC/YbaW family acyl-CoA thioester hydrolase
MPRIKIDLPGAFQFSTVIPVRITDINYGGHVGNDTILSIVHEARVQFLKFFGYQELNLGGMGLIMRDVAIEFKKEVFYGDQITVSVTAAEFAKVTFELYYQLEIENEGKSSIVATAKTGMVCYDYSNKKIAAIPHGVKERLAGH